MNMFSTRTEQLDALLGIICEELQLPPSLHDLADQRYRAVGDWLAAPGSDLAAWHPAIYPQGSFRIGTTVRPLRGEEFDLDLVCEFHLGAVDVSPLVILNLVEGRLRRHRDYARMIERKKRCIRLSYANEFHLDILPAREASPLDTGILIPDRELAAWLPSNPKGYAAWFEGRSNLFYERMRKLAIEPLPSHENANQKTSLQRAVQLLKRWRDVCYEKNPDAAPRSIVLTTLSGQFFTGTLSTSLAFGEVIGTLTAAVGSNPTPLHVVNPSEPNEVLSEQWQREPQTYRLFGARIAELHDQWRSLQSDTMEDAARRLRALFGESVTQRAFKRLTDEEVETHRREGTLGVLRSRGALSVGSVAGVSRIRSNTFYGED